MPQWCSRDGLLIAMVITPIRTVRIDDELWNAALAKAAGEGTTLSSVIRELLANWTTTDKRTK
jgi:antitoxin component of RelBE/YafQ-DinJ toxin-antitoxin module